MNCFSFGGCCGSSGVEMMGRPELLRGLFPSEEGTNRYRKLGDCVRTVDPKIRVRWKLEGRQAMEKAQMMFVCSGIKGEKAEKCRYKERPYNFLEAAIAKPRVNSDVRLSFQFVAGHRLAFRRIKKPSSAKRTLS
jgi:hypothetical protein